MRPRLSILISTSPEKWTQVAPLIEELHRQCEATQAAEVITLCETFDTSGSRKEQQLSLLALAKGEFITFFDATLDVRRDFVDSVLEAMRAEAKKHQFSTLFDGRRLWNDESEQLSHIDAIAFNAEMRGYDCIGLPSSFIVQYDSAQTLCETNGTICMMSHNNATASAAADPTTITSREEAKKSTDQHTQPGSTTQVSQDKTMLNDAKLSVAAVGWNDNCGCCRSKRRVLDAVGMNRKGCGLVNVSCDTVSSSDVVLLPRSPHITMQLNKWMVYRKTVAPHMIDFFEHMTCRSKKATSSFSTGTDGTVPSVVVCEHPPSPHAFLQTVAPERILRIDDVLMRYTFTQDQIKA